MNGARYKEKKHNRRDFITVFTVKTPIVLDLPSIYTKTFACGTGECVIYVYLLSSNPHTRKSTLCTFCIALMHTSQGDISFTEMRMQIFASNHPINWHINDDHYFTNKHYLLLHSDAAPNWLSNFVLHFFLFVALLIQYFMHLYAPKEVAICQNA